ncbi:MAG: tryptophan-rich sensory protein [Cyanobacteria bacterium P01_G01_bin.54]
MSSKVLRPFLTLVIITAAFTFNVLSNVQPINGESIGAISNTTFSGVMITPANYAFSIWGLIYLGLLGFGIYQLLWAHHARPDLNPVRNALIISSLAQMIWVFLFLLRLFWASGLAMLVILVALVWGYGQHRAQGSLSRADRWFVERPLSLYLGWISVATVVNGAIVFYGWGWQQAMPLWTVVMIGVVTLLGCGMTWIYRDGVFSGVFVWALAAIAMRQSANGLILGTALAGCGVLVTVMVLTLLRRQRESAG